MPVTIRDADGDDLEGQIHVGRAETGASLIAPATYERIIGGSYELRNDDNATLRDAFYRLEFRPVGALAWTTQLRRGALPTEIDISSVPAGDAAVAIGAADGLTWGFGQNLFTKPQAKPACC